MQYSMRQGIQNSWYEQLESTVRNFDGRNWLPIGGGAIIALWISLLFMSVTQRVPLVPGAVSNQPKQTTAQGLAVSYRNSSANSSALGMQGGTNMTTAMQSSQSTIQRTSPNRTILSSGGKGAVNTTSPVNPVTNPITSNPVGPDPATTVSDPITPANPVSTAVEPVAAVPDPITAIDSPDIEASDVTVITPVTNLDLGIESNGLVGKVGTLL